MLEPLKERTRDTCETRIRGGPPEATGLSLVTQPGYSVSASPVFSFSYRQDFSAGGGWRVTGDGWRVAGDG